MDGGSVQHASNRQDLPPLAECVPSGLHVPTAQAKARAEVQSKGVTCSLKVVRTPQGPRRDCHDAICVRVDDESSSSSASSANKPRKKPARKACAAQHGMKGRVDAADFLQEQSPLRTDRRDARARAVEYRGSTYCDGFAANTTNRGVVTGVRRS